MPDTVKIFVLEDNSVFLDTIGEIFDRDGIENYQLFYDHHKFMTQFDATVDIAILDHRLKENTTALDLIDRIYLKNKNVFIIILSGMKDFGILLAYTNKGIDRYILKDDGIETLRLLRKFINEGIEKMMTFRKRRRDGR